ncbi:MAG TPA: hypothetical protein VJG29_01130 [Candidatus Paceibacterota bacterium]
MKKIPTVARGKYTRLWKAHRLEGAVKNRGIRNTRKPKKIKK